MKACWIILPLLVACESQSPSPEQDPTTSDMGVETRLDMMTLSDMSTDAALTDAIAMDAEVGERDADPLEGWTLEPNPSPEDTCNGIDDDGDGLLDEGLANICGGCEPIPAQGCQGWQINTIGRSDGRVFPDRIVGLAAHVLKDEIFETDNGLCSVRIYRQPPEADAHLGEVTIRTDRFDQQLYPSYDEVRQSIVYAPEGSIDPQILDFDEPALFIDGSGGALVGEFETEMAMPSPLRGVDDTDLEFIVNASRGDPNEGATTLHWLPEDGPINLYVGGSVPLFQNGRNYRGIEHYIFRARLEDDGVFRMPVEIFDGGIADSSVWVYVMRDAHRAIPIGPHAIHMTTGRRIEARGAGRQEGEQAPPFQIISPAPNEPVVEAGAPLSVQWGPLPDGTGPLTATFSTRVNARGEHQQMVCTITDPSLGSFTVPGERTADWNLEMGDFHQLNLNWVVDGRYFDGDDSGSWQRSLAVLLRLDR